MTQETFTPDEHRPATMHGYPTVLDEDTIKELDWEIDTDTREIEKAQENYSMAITSYEYAEDSEDGDEDGPDLDELRTDMSEAYNDLIDAYEEAFEEYNEVTLLDEAAAYFRSTAPIFYGIY